MPRIAFMTIGLLHAPSGDPRVQGFIERIDTVYASAEASDGFLDRSRTDELTGMSSWGERHFPHIFQKDEYLDRRPATLSLWSDLESVFAYAYSGAHAEALSKRQEWFVRPQWPTYVAWWVDDEHRPTWQEASLRYDMLIENGPGPQAFDFKKPFDSQGQPVVLDRKRIRHKAAE